MSKKPYVVGIAGGTCSGKSTITARLAAALEGKCRVTVFNMDRYFKRPGMSSSLAAAPFMASTAPPTFT